MLDNLESVTTATHEDSEPAVCYGRRRSGTAQGKNIQKIINK